MDNLWEAVCWSIASDVRFHDKLRYQIYSEPCVNSLHLHYSQHIASLLFHPTASEDSRNKVIVQLGIILPVGWDITVDEPPPSGALEIQ